MEAEARRPRSPALLALLVGLGVLCLAGLLALGVWQVERLQWKRGLIAQVDGNMKAAPVAAPAPAQWNLLAPRDAYRRVRAQGRFDFQREVLVRGTTALGSGYWVLTPLRTEAGWWLLVNRGFVPPALRGQVPRGEAVQEVAGLLRWSEPGGGLLQPNVPAEGRWYSRDVAALAATVGLDGPVAPFFVDAQPAPGADPQAWPRPGLTVVRFSDNHLVYALTWFALAAIMAAAIAFLLVDERRLRRRAGADLAAPRS